MQSMSINTNKRLFLRPLSFSDAKALAELANDKSIAKNMEKGAFPYPYTLEDAYHFIEWAEYAKIANEGFNFAVELEEEMVGIAGIYGIDKSIRKGSVGYWIGKKHRGNGYGKEAVRQLLAFAFGAADLKMLNAMCLSSNLSSKSLLMALGFSRKSSGRIEEFCIKNEDYIKGINTQNAP